MFSVQTPFTSNPSQNQDASGDETRKRWNRGGDFGADGGVPANVARNRHEHRHQAESVTNRATRVFIAVFRTIDYLVRDEISKSECLPPGHRPRRSTAIDFGGRMVPPASTL
jgi:hypothetical protein